MEIGTRRYVATQGAKGWTILDVRTGRPAVIAGEVQENLVEAVALAGTAALNGLEAYGAMRRARRAAASGLLEAAAPEEIVPAKPIP